MAIALQVLLAVLGSQALVELLKWAFDRKDSKDGIKAKLTKLEKDGLRTQLLLLVLMMPKETKEIMTLGEHYFSKPPKGLDGNWYMTDIFKKWLKDYRHETPTWFEPEK